MFTRAVHPPAFGLTIAIALLAAMATGGGPVRAQGVTNPPAFAVVATNNRSLTLARPDLHYADDDGAKYAQLFSDLFGEGNVTLLTNFDAGSRLLFPGWAKRAKRPTLARFEAAIDEAVQRTVAARHKGQTADIYLVLAGHGDVSKGKGFVELADGPLTAERLDQALGRLKAANVHLLLDSCNSWFMLNPRKPGGRRWASDRAPKLLKKYPNVGALISTSSEGVTYEWSQLQSGIFSYEVRSGLRGGADIDQDGRVSYAELEAFIHVANSQIVNPLYRPKIYARAPSNRTRQALAGWGSRTRARKVRVPSKGDRHFTVRDRNGVRLMDAHKEDGTPLTLHLPLTGRFTVEEKRPPAAKGQRPQRRVLVLGDKAQGTGLEKLPRVTDAIRARGTEAPVFEKLFAAPYGRKAYKRHLARTSTQSEPVYYSATLKDVVRLRDHLQTAAELEKDGSTYVGMMSIGGSVSGFGLGTALAFDKSLTGTQRDASLGVAFGAGTLMLASGLTTLLTAREGDQLLAQIESMRTATPRQRSQGLETIEARLETLVERYETVRMVNGGIVAGGGALMLIPGVVGLTNVASDSNTATTASSFVAGVGLVAMGIYLLTEYRFPIERTWELYLRQRDSQLPADSDVAEDEGGVKVGPSVSTSGEKPTPTLGVQGSF